MAQIGTKSRVTPGYTEVVPPEYLSQFKNYVKAFYLLYKHKLVQEPDLQKVTVDQADLLSDFSNDDRTPIFKSARAREDQWAYQTVMNSNILLPDGVAQPKRFSAAMIYLMGKVARYSSYCEMSVAETTALAIYIGLGFRKLNTYLRSKGEQNPKLDLLEKITNHALDKIENSRRLVYRTTRFFGQQDMPESVYHQHVTGSDIVYDAFTSTSSAAFETANFLIYSKTGKDLGPLSTEREVLFKSHTHFRVRYNSCEQESLKVWQSCNVILEEFESQPKH